MNENRFRDKLVAEESTGILEHGALIFQTADGEITQEEAYKRLYNGEEVAVPAAGAGSYQEIFEMLGFTNIKLVDSTSSAGDWTFGIKNATGWHLAWQENRFPHYGFRYTIDTKEYGHANFEDLLKEVVM